MSAGRTADRLVVAITGCLLPTPGLRTVLGGGWVPDPEGAPGGTAARRDRLRLHEAQEGVDDAEGVIGDRVPDAGFAADLERGGRAAVLERERRLVGGEGEAAANGEPAAGAEADQADADSGAQLSADLDRVDPDAERERVLGDRLLRRHPDRVRGHAPPAEGEAEVAVDGIFTRGFERAL